MNKFCILLVSLSFSCSRESSKEHKVLILENPSVEHVKSVEKPQLEFSQQLPLKAREFADKLSEISAKISSGQVSKEDIVGDLKLYFKLIDPNLRNTYQVVIFNFFKNIKYYDVQSYAVIYKEVLKVFPLDYSVDLMGMIIADSKVESFVHGFITLSAPELADALVKVFSIDDSFALIVSSELKSGGEHYSVIYSILYWSWFEKDFKLTQEFFIKDKVSHKKSAVMFEIGKYYGIKAHQEGVEVFVPIALQYNQERSIVCFVHSWVHRDYVKAISWVDSYPKGKLRDEMIAKLNDVFRYVKTNDPELYTKLKIELSAHSLIQ